MRTLTLVLLACIVALPLIGAPAAAEQGPSTGGDTVCVPGLTLCCTISGESIGDGLPEVPTQVRCL